MPKRKVREAPPAPRAKPRDRKRVATDSAGSDGPQHSVNLVDLSGPQHSANLVDFPTSPNLNRETMSTQRQPPALNREQLDEVTRAVIAAMSCRAETSHPQNEMTQDASAEYPGTDILPTLAISNNQKSHVQSYHNDLGHNVSNNLKLKIANGEYVNLGLLVDRTNESDPNDDTKYFSMQGGNITLSSKYKPKVITDIQVWTDAFLVYASIYVLAHPECSTALFKYMHTIRLGASRAKALGWRDYDIQFRLKKECNPNMSFAVVDQELWLLYMYSPLAVQGSVTQNIPLRCYEFNYKGQCNKSVCQYKHECILCSLNHPYIKCRRGSGSDSTYRPNSVSTSWRPQLPRMQSTTSTYARPALPQRPRAPQATHQFRP